MKFRMAFPVTKELLFWVTGEIGKVDREKKSRRSNCYGGDITVAAYDNFGALINSRPTLEEMQ